ALRELQQVPGRRLFQYPDEGGKPRQISASDINLYLGELSGGDVTAKDFRTLAATAAAGERLCAIEAMGSATKRRKQVAEVMREVAALLGNTPAVVRKSYVHR